MDLIQGKRIGLLGGTFDPVHYGHIAAAEAVAEKLHLDTIVFIPAYQPPHKDHPATSPFFHRASMLELALKPWPQFSISYVEAERNGPSYTCDTLADLCEKTDSGAKLFFVTGIDAFKEIHTWKKYEKLLHFADLAVIARPPHEEKSLEKYIREYFAGYRSDTGKNAWISPETRGQIHVISMSPVHISSTEIRERISHGEDVGAMISADVFSYIKKESLYQRK